MLTLAMKLRVENWLQKAELRLSIWSVVDDFLDVAPARPDMKRACTTIRKLRGDMTLTELAAIHAQIDYPCSVRLAVNGPYVVIHVFEDKD